MLSMLLVGVMLFPTSSSGLPSTKGSFGFFVPSTIEATTKTKKSDDKRSRSHKRRRRVAVGGRNKTTTTSKDKQKRSYQNEAVDK
mmetsp:Transcript_44587/g.108088  ORF Transcript_44587/g.108088 Transcript_44587/m.108088 type:complete len:85 (-) Transcript_44587:1158-1412(-)